jgi:hypothetical protein
MKHRNEVIRPGWDNVRGHEIIRPGRLSRSERRLSRESVWTIMQLVRCRQGIRGGVIADR